MHTTHATLESWEMDQKRFYDHSEADTDSQYDRYSTSTRLSSDHEDSAFCNVDLVNYPEKKIKR